MIIPYLLFVSQDSVQDIGKKDLPGKALCVVCHANGNDHGLEKPSAGVNFKGKSYYFCNVKEVAEFKKDPEAFLPPVLPRPLPTFELSDSSGKLWNVESFTGKTVLIDFWATWCGPCKEQMPALDKLHAALSPKGFELLSVSIDEKKSAFDGFVARRKFPNPVLWDDKATWEKFKVRAIPAMFLVKNGQIVAQWTGKQKPEVIRSAVEKHLAP